MTQSNIKVAITGGIGSGKSTVAEIIAKHGYPVISCDEIYKKLLYDKNFLNKLLSEFGNILTEQGGLDRNKLSALVFSDKAKLKTLNEITHPAIMKEALKQMSGKGTYFCEVPLLFEGGFEKLFDKVIVVMREDSARVAAVAKRDKIAEKEVISRVNSQFNYNILQFEKYYVIHNDGSLTDLSNETIKIIEKINK